jgi:predicted ester cyclase
MGDARRVAEAFVDAFNAHDESRIRELMAGDVGFEAPGDVRLQGPEYAMAWLRAFPDARLTVHNTVAACDWEVAEFSFEGTHEDTLVGAAGEIPATHRRLVGRGTQITRAAGGALADIRLYFDQVQVLTQLGLMPEPAATA